MRGSENHGYVAIHLIKGNKITLYIHCIVNTSNESLRFGRWPYLYE